MHKVINGNHKYIYRMLSMNGKTDNTLTLSMNIQPKKSKVWTLS